MALGMRQRGLFGRQLDRSTPPFATPGIGDGAMQHTAQERVAMQPAAEPKKPGLFGQGGVGRYMAGAIGDALLQNADMAPIYAPAMQAQQQAAQQSAAAQMKRAQDLADWRWKEDYQRDNKPPAAPNLREDNAGNVWQFDPQTGQPMGDKPVWIDPTEKVIYQDGMQIRVPNPYRTGGQAQTSIAPGTVDGGYRFKGGDPADQNNWEPVAGGPSQSATGRFRR